MERLREIEAELSGIAPALGKTGILATPYQVPEGYFERFHDGLMKKIGLAEEAPDAELEALSPLLAGLQRQAPYQAPEGYFTEFEVPLPAPATRGASVFSLHSLRPFVRYAAAAMITGVLAATVFFSFHKSNADPLGGLTNISDQEMANYLENHDVHWVPGTSPAPIASVDFDENDISALLTNVSDDELEQYQSALPANQRTIN